MSGHVRLAGNVQLTPSPASSTSRQSKGVSAAQSGLGSAAQVAHNPDSVESSSHSATLEGEQRSVGGPADDVPAAATTTEAAAATDVAAAEGTEDTQQQTVTAAQEKKPSSQEERREEKEDVDFTLVVSDGGMALLSSLVPGCEWQSGAAAIDLRVHGSLSSPGIDGSARLARGLMKMPFLRNPLQGLGANLTVSEDGRGESNDILLCLVGLGGIG